MTYDDIELGIITEEYLNLVSRVASRMSRQLYRWNCLRLTEISAL